MANELQQGDVIAERFAIERLVADGGMGTVYRAVDREGGGPVALKVIGVSPNEPVAAERFEREAALLAKLRHPRIVSYVGHGKAKSGQLYLAMQWLDGEDLQAALARGPLSLKDTLLVLEGTAEALAAVHAQGVVHRDLKPGNLFLRGGLVAGITLLDFGIARPPDSTWQLTASGVLLGTPHYMAPEQAGDTKQIQPATDVFALGCIFYECLTGRPPFEASHVAGVLAKILFDAPVPVERLRPSVPRPWAELCARMLSKEPAGRPKDATVLLHELTRLPPPSGSADPTAALTLDDPPPLDIGGEQTLICVILATFPGSSRSDAEATGTSLRPGMPDRGSTSLRALARFGFVVEGLANGSVLATLSSPGAATDQARVAARGALFLHELWPDARIAVATGRALLRQTTSVGEAVDRATRLLERSGEPAVVGDETGSILLDSMTARLLDARFVMEPLGDQVLLRAERPDADESRLLLGKPTPCVGRELELTQLESLMGRAALDGEAQAALVLAPSGTGKSRLRHELVRRLRDKHPEAKILTGYADPRWAAQKSKTSSPGSSRSRRKKSRSGHSAGERASGW